jgi:hypothetical protein
MQVLPDAILLGQWCTFMFILFDAVETVDKSNPKFTLATLCRRM